MKAAYYILLVFSLICDLTYTENNHRQVFADPDSFPIKVPIPNFGAFAQHGSYHQKSVPDQPSSRALHYHDTLFLPSGSYPISKPKNSFKTQSLTWKDVQEVIKYEKKTLNDKNPFTKYISSGTSPKEAKDYKYFYDNFQKESDEIINFKDYQITQNDLKSDYTSPNEYYYYYDYENKDPLTLGDTIPSGSISKEESSYLGYDKPSSIPLFLDFQPALTTPFPALYTENPMVLFDHNSYDNVSISTMNYGGQNPIQLETVTLKMMNGTTNFLKDKIKKLITPPKGTVFTINFKTVIPYGNIFSKTAWSLIGDYRFAIAFKIANLIPNTFRHKRSVVTYDRSAIYSLLSDFIAKLGYDGESCLLRAVCEAGEDPLYEYGILGDIFSVVLAPGFRGDETEEEYLSAENYGVSHGGCWAKYRDCPLSLRELLHSGISTASGISSHS